MISRPVRAVVAAAAVAGLVAAQPAGAAPGPSDAPEYWFDTWHIEQLWAQGARGQGVTIAEIDTGVNAQIPELSGRVLSGTDFGESGNGQIDREINEFGHGTAMASIMVARPGLLGITGIAPGARVLPIAVPLDGTVDFATSDQLPRAIRWAADHGAKVISMSIGGKRSAANSTMPCPDDEQAAVFHALRKGAVVVAAVGNSGPQHSVVEEPGVCLGVVAVGAVDESGRVATFSGRVPYLTLTAPGVSVPSLSRVPGTAYSGDGTSQATAIVAAVFALVRSKYPRLTAEQAVTRVLATLDGRRSTPSTSYGYGSVNAYRAVTARVPASAANPVFERAAPFLARDRAYLRAATPAAPKPAATGIVSTGSFVVGDVPRVTSQVRTGIAIAAAGLLALLALLTAGLRARRRTPRVAAPVVAVGPLPVGADARPRPRPYPALETRLPTPSGRFSEPQIDHTG